MTFAHCTARLKAAFSLTEVTLVIGIAAVTILPMVSLLPFGLNTLRSSASRTAEARMLQAIASDYQMRVWIKTSTGISTRIVELTDGLYHFDQAGLIVAKGSQGHVYTVKSIVHATGPTLNNDGTGGTNPYLRQLKVRITDRPDADEALQDHSGQYWERSLMVANIEQTGPLAVNP